MNIKLLKKIILLLIFFLILCMIFSNNTFASSPKTVDELIGKADDFINIDNGEDDPIDTETLKETSNYVYNVLYTIAVAIAVITGSILGIKFMIESAEDKAKIKEAMIPFVVGCFVVFGSFGIWKIAVNVGTSFTYSGETKYNYKSAETYEEYKKNNGNNDIETAKKLIDLDVSKLSDSEKENYKIIIKQAKSNLTNYKGEIEGRTELINELDDKLKELDK